MDEQTREQAVSAVVRRYVLPGHRFMYLASGNLRSLDGSARDRFGTHLAEDARAITDDELRQLFEAGWQERLVGAWLVAMDRRLRFRPLIVRLLLEDETVSAGQGYCIALARLGEAADAEALLAYLDEYLPRRGGHQEWAMGALLHLDARHGTDLAARYLGPDGAWHTWVAMGRDPEYTNPANALGTCNELCAFAEAYAPG